MREVLVLALTFAAGAALCMAAGITPANDPLLLLEVVAAALGGSWAVAVGRNLFRARALARELDALSESRVVDGIAVEVVPAAGRVALVLGVLRPKIYVGEDLLRALERDERQAVLLHEHHHRATRAPMRAAALESWILLAGRISSVRRVLLERLGDLESMADSYAIARGCTRAALAGALLKTDASAAGVSAFSYGSERRIVALVDGPPSATGRHHLAYEWLPAAVIATLVIACHSFGL